MMIEWSYGNGSVGFVVSVVIDRHTFLFGVLKPPVVPSQ
jgi:hypothetical protein